MGFTQDQKAAIGNHYIAEIKARIDTRTKAKDRLGAVPSPDDEDDTDGPASKEKAINIVAARVAKRLVPSFKGVPKAWAHSEYVGGNSTPGIWMEIEAHRVFIPETLAPELQKLREAKKKLREAKKAKDDLKGQLCQEIEFLTKKALAPSTVAAFQAHAGRLLAPKAKDTIAPTTVRALLDDFLVSKRDFVCTLK